MTDTERDTLEKRIDELCAENERLRQENQSIEMTAYELRELCRDLRKEYAYLRARPRRFYVQHEARMAAIDDRIRMLGVEVDNG